MSDDMEMFGLPTTEKGPIDFTSVHKMFDAAVKNGLKKPRFYAAHGIRLSLAPSTGKNPGAIYVKRGEDYMGKIVNGKFIPAAAIANFVLDVLREVAENPLDYAITQGRETGNCAICGKLLTNKVSVARGIGPICASRFGFDGFTAEEIEADETGGEVVETETATVEVVTLATCRAFALSESGLPILDGGEMVMEYCEGLKMPFKTYYRYEGGTKYVMEFETHKEALECFRADCKNRLDFIRA